MPQDAPDCIFCRIASGQVPAHTVYQDEHVLGFMDTSPLADGHLLVIPRDHYERITDMPPEAIGRLFAQAGRLGGALLQVTGTEGLNVLQNNGRVAGQAVMHVHVHLIPRREGDGLGYRWSAGQYPPGRAEQLAGAIKAALA